MPIFLIFAPKHRLWVLVRTTSPRRLYFVPTIYVLSKNKKNISAKNFQFLKLKNLCILHGHVFVIELTCVCLNELDIYSALLPMNEFSVLDVRDGERGGLVVEYRTPEQEVLGSIPTYAMKQPT